MAAKARGVKFGRKRKLAPQQVAHARKTLQAGDTLIVWKLDRLGRRVQAQYDLAQVRRDRIKLKRLEPA